MGNFVRDALKGYGAENAYEQTPLGTFSLVQYFTPSTNQTVFFTFLHSGNYQLQKPYTKGPAATKCPSNYVNQNGLCGKLLRWTRRDALHTHAHL